MAGETTGRFGAVSVGGALSSVRDWRASRMVEPRVLYASNTKGGPVRRPGVSDWNGGYSAWGGNPAVMPGGTGTFIGYIAPTSGVEGTIGPTVTGLFMCNGITVNWDWTSGEVINHSVNLEGNGPMTDSTGTILDGSAVTAPAVGPSLVQIKIGAGGAYAAICVAQATLNITAQNGAYVNSCGYSGGKLNRKRSMGNIDWNVSLTLQQANIAAAGLSIGDWVALKMFVGDTNFWDLQWGFVHDFSDIVVDRQSSEIIQYTAQISMSGDDGTNAVNGLIKLPGAGSNWWPFA